MKENKIEIKFNIAYQQGDNIKEQLFVSSHERSGTHFLMNSIDSAFQYYSSKKYINFDYQRLGSLCLGRSAFFPATKHLLKHFQSHKF